MKLSLLTATVFLTPFTFLIRHNEKIEDAAWLIGTWEQKTAKMPIYESWRRVSNVAFSGESYMVKEKDTVVFETIQLIQEQHELYYIPTVKNHNNGQPVRFALKSISDKQLVFENPSHDFPQTIIYSRIGTDSLIAEISGSLNGQVRKQSFPMKKVNFRSMGQ